MTRGSSSQGPPEGPPDAPTPIGPSSPEPASSPGSSPPAPPDIIPGIFPAGEVHLFSGASGVGKTAFVADFISRIATARPILGEIFVGRRPSFIGVIASDRRWKDHQQWWEAAGFPEISHYSLTEDERVTGKSIRSRKLDRFDLFCTSVSKLCSGDPPPDSLLLLDPASLFLGGNLLDYDRVFSHMHDLNQYCFTRGITILALCHTGKQKGDASQRYARPQDRIMGSTAQTGCAGTTFHLAPPTETEHPWYELTWVPHHAPAETIKLTRDREGLFVEYVPTTDDAHDEEAAALFGDGKRGRRLYAILSFFPSDGSNVPAEAVLQQIEALLHVKRAMAYRYLGQLTGRGLVVEGTEPNTYRLVRKN